MTLVDISLFSCRILVYFLFMYDLILIWAGKVWLLLFVYSVSAVLLSNEKTLLCSIIQHFSRIEFLLFETGTWQKHCWFGYEKFSVLVQSYGNISMLTFRHTNFIVTSNLISIKHFNYTLYIKKLKIGSPIVKQFLSLLITAKF